MFTLMAYGLGNNANAADQVLTQLAPSQLTNYLEVLWRRPRAPARDLIFPALGAGAALVHRSWGQRLSPLQLGWTPVPPAQGFWHHLIYAYMVEQTGIVEILRRVIEEYVHGERLPQPGLATQNWIRVTEELFFTNPRPSAIRALTSDIRPDAAAIRRNAYYRMFGLDLTHGAPGGGPYRYVKADAANREFARAFEQFLVEAWRGYENRNNGIGPNKTDDDAILEMARQLREMLTSRRMYGTLTREEFDAVCTLSWFHLTVLYDTAIVNDLTAFSASPALRLKKIADIVRVPMHSKADSYFQMAEDISWILIFIENGTIEAGPANLVYAGGGLLQQAVQRVITHWSITTGRNIKGDSLRVGPAMIPLGLPTPSAPAPSTPVAGGVVPSSRLQVAIR